LQLAGGPFALASRGVFRELWHVKRPVLVGCGLTLLVLVAGAVLLIYSGAPKMRDAAVGWFQKMMAEAEKEAAFERGWAPPAGGSAESWLPAEVGDYALSTQVLLDEAPEFQDVRKSHSASYTRGGEKIDVSIFALRRSRGTGFSAECRG
jgi:hypothetical protein